MALVGNIVIASLLAFSVIIIGIFDIFPNTFEANQEQMTLAFSILLDYAKFAFIINLVREIVKDIQDIEGDTFQNMKTLPIIIGVQMTKIFAFIVLLFSILYLLYYSHNYLFENNLFYGFSYILGLVIAPMLVCLVQLWNAKNKEDYIKISTFLKWIILFGILSIAIITFNIKNNA